MKNRRKEKIAYKKEKVVLSDILPYEVPVIFNNSGFYRFLVKNKIEFKDGKIIYDKSKKGIKKIVDFIFPDKNQKYDKTQPFQFRTSHKNNSYRTLSIIHPRNQLKIIAFYHEFKETIKYFSNISQYSIRKPYKVAKTRYVNDYLYQQKKIAENDSHIEINKEKTENIKTFFAYKKYSNIHKFFESYEYQQSEKQFDYLYKFDISKCFDSIYTHSISWALYNKEIVKDNIKDSNGTFAGKFDALMQNMNYGETNGILIGSEVARIFAEILLQQIDKIVFDELYKEGVVHKKNYKIYRYVDDYFLFYSNEDLKNKILDMFTRHLKSHHLFISETKSYQYNRPIITELTIAKTKITDLISDKLSITLLDEKKFPTEKDSPPKPKKQWHIGFKSKDLIIRFKIIIKEANIEYKDVINYSVAIVEKRILKTLSKVEKEEFKGLYSKDLLRYIYDVLTFVFFVYSVSPRVTATIKIVSIISKLLDFLKGDNPFSKHQKEHIYKKIFDEIYQIIATNKTKEYSQNETLYLLIALSELGTVTTDYDIDSKLLEEHFLNKDMDYFAITTLLFYIKDNEKYESLKNKIIEKIKEKFKKSNPDNRKKNTEIVMLLLDLLSCPFIDKKDKKSFLDLVGIKKNKDDFTNFNKQWFIKWSNFNLSEEIEIKKSQEVYS